LQYLPEAVSERVVETKVSQNNISYDKPRTAKRNNDGVIKKGSFQAVSPYVTQSMQRNEDEVRHFSDDITVNKQSLRKEVLEKLMHH